MTTSRLLPGAIVLLFCGAIGFGLAIHFGWLTDPALTRTSPAPAAEVTADEGRFYRTVPFEWRASNAAGSFTGRDIVHIRIDDAAEPVVVCGWLKTGKAGASVRAARWLTEARLHLGTTVISAAFIGLSETTPGNDLHAGCAALPQDIRPSRDAALELEGPPVHE